MDWTGGTTGNASVGLPTQVLGSQFWAWSTSACDTPEPILCMQK
jgi:hypothetical protein